MNSEDLHLITMSTLDGSTVTGPLILPSWYEYK